MRRLYLGAAAAQAVSDGGILLGEVCPACLLAGPEHMASELKRRARLSRLQAEEGSETEPGRARSLAERKESLVEQRQHVGGVSEEQRSEQERRFEDLGLEEFFWSFIKLQSRVDDLEEQVRELRGAKAGQ